MTWRWCPTASSPTSPRLAENEERLHALIEDAEVPGERLAKLFEPEVLPPETGSGADDGGEGGDVD